MDDEIIKFLFELAQLKRIKHEGWRLVGVEHPDSVAEHSLRAAQIAFFLADAEGHPEPEKAIAMVVFHDIPETRIGDLHRVALRYAKPDEPSAVRDQTAKLGEAGRKIRELWEEFEARETDLSKIAKDADRLEQALTAKEYIEKGHDFAVNWIDNIRKVLHTNTAKRWLEKIAETDSNVWWQGLKKLDIRG
jgi:putative hydrolases of HD superfamily